MSDSDGSSLTTMTDNENDPLVQKDRQRRKKVLEPEDELHVEEPSVQDILNCHGYHRIHTAFIIALGVIAMADSLQAAYVAVVLPVLTCEWDLSAFSQAVITSSIFAGTGVGAILLGYASDMLGRRLVALLSSIIMLSSMILTSLAPDPFTFAIFGTLSGVSCGGSLSVAYTYWAEVSSESYRYYGILAITMLWNLGMLVCNLIAYLCLNRVGWRLYAVMISIPALIPIFMLPFLPESPKFLNMKKKYDAFIKSLSVITKSSREELAKLKIAPEPCNQGSLLASFSSIFSPDILKDTVKTTLVYVALQTLYKGLLYLVTHMIAYNYCGLGTGLPITVSNETAGTGPEHCDHLTNGDFINAMLLSVAFFPSTLFAVFSCQRYGELPSLRVFSFAYLTGIMFLFVCLPKVLMFIAIGWVVFFVAGISLIMYIMLPAMYPTVARNSGFGLVDGIGKIIASFAIFGITALLNYSIRWCLGFFVLIAVGQIIFAFMLRYNKVV